MTYAREQDLTRSSTFLVFNVFTINFPISSPFTASHKFWHVVFWVSLVSKYFLIPPVIFLWFIGFFKSVLFNFNSFFCKIFHFSSVTSNFSPLWSEKILYMTSVFSKSVEIKFVASHMVYPGKYLMYTWEECACCWWVEYSVYVCYIYLIYYISVCFLLLSVLYIIVIDIEVSIYTIELSHLSLQFHQLLLHIFWWSLIRYSNVYNSYICLLYQSFLKYIMSFFDSWTFSN